MNRARTFQFSVVIQPFRELAIPRSINGFAVDKGVHMFDSIPAELAELIADIMDGQVKTIEFVSASAFNGTLTEGYSLPDLSSLDEETKRKIKTEVLARGELAARATVLSSNGKKVLALAIASLPEGVRGLALEDDASDYARHLYAALRKLDAERADRLLIEAPPPAADWDAVRDRLGRASTPGEPDGS